MPQHVIQRGTDRSVLFVADADYRFFHECLVTACRKHGCRVHAYVFMTNHVHLLLTPEQASSVGRVMQSVCRRYIQRFNDTYRRTGSLCQGRYKASLVNTEQYLFACHQYIELNPVRAGLVDDPANYPWSSYAANALGALDPLVMPHECYGTLGADTPERQVAYRAMFRVLQTDETLNSIREATNGGWALGSKRFRDEIATLLARRTEPAPKGHRSRRNDSNRV